jgi:2-polyprenyl-6-methoxyphenol hydroxylase-like FAD-dependent oxidoreductase
MTYVAGPARDFDEARRDSTAHLLATLDRAGSLGERARGAVQVGSTRGTNDLPNIIRAGYGPGWALAGDAGLVMDPITGLGIGHALRDAELLSTAIAAGLGGEVTLERALARYEKQRNRETKPAFDFTVGLANLGGVSATEERMFAAIGATDQEASLFLGALTGTVPMRRFFTPSHIIRLVGVRDFVRLARTRPR